MTFAILCPGQGAQHAAMLDLALASPAGLRIMAAASTAIGVDLRHAVTDPALRIRNQVAQPLLCATQLAQWHALRDALPRPAALAGYSVGELACYGVAGALDTRPLVELATARAHAMDAVSSRGTLIGVRGLDRNAVSRLCAANGAYVAIAVDDDVFVVGGSAEALALAADAMPSTAQVTRLDVGVPSHTPLMAAAVAAFRASLERSSLRAPDVAIVAGIDAASVPTRARAIETLARQLAETVEWSRCVDALYERGCRVFLELGPGRALAKTVLSRHEGAVARSIDDFRSLEAVIRWVTREIG